MLGWTVLTFEINALKFFLMICFQNLFPNKRLISHKLSLFSQPLRSDSHQFMMPVSTIMRGRAISKFILKIFIKHEYMYTLWNEGAQLKIFRV